MVNGTTVVCEREKRRGRERWREGEREREREGVRERKGEKEGGREKEREAEDVVCMCALNLYFYINCFCESYKSQNTT